MNYKTLNYLIKITANYVQPKVEDREVFHRLVNEFLALNFYPKIQEEQSLKFSMDGGQPQRAVNQVVSLISSDSQWLINFPRDGFEIVYNSKLEEGSEEIDEKTFLTSAIRYIDLLIKHVDVKQYLRVGFVSNKYNDKSDAEYISSIFPEFDKESMNTLEMQNNIITSVNKDGIKFNVLKNQGYYKEGRINYIGGVKDFCGTTIMRDINTSLDNAKSVNFENILNSIQNIILGE